MAKAEIFRKVKILMLDHDPVSVKTETKDKKTGKVTETISLVALPGYLSCYLTALATGATFGKFLEIVNVVALNRAIVENKPNPKQHVREGKDLLPVLERIEKTFGDADYAETWKGHKEFPKLTGIPESAGKSKKAPVALSAEAFALLAGAVNGVIE